ncbi:MAG: hypothetical protein IPJ61_06230 [Tessaracoccus sp.]|uniref:hypothetical protein n=1 Tax=Tessaracoccus sp. TaxID=1971211 RepID=UPI001ED236A7|nr:hypothetical protein [Tessaracoccus sp.]MBK7820667.1 hypothetical protein [Tessaracoccus sp.]
MAVEDILAALGLTLTPAWAPRAFLRFFLSAADAARVAPGSLRVSEGPLDGPASMDVSFTVLDPLAGPPQLRPLFPGALTFVADPAAPGTLPEPAATQLTPAGYATWRTRGTLRVTVTDAAVDAALKDHTSALGVQPNVAFYSPVQLSQDFLLTTLPTRLRKDTVKGAGTVVRPANAAWPRHAVSRFLQGSHAPVLRLGTVAADDDVIAHPMPTVVMAPGGDVSLRIVVARAQSPQDGPDSALDALAPGIAAADPRHPRNAPLPAREVYRTLRPHMIDAAVGSAVPDACLASWPAARRYFPFRVTRTWQDVPNFSVLFPPRSAVVDISTAPTMTLGLPAHGVVFVPQDPGSGTPPATPSLSLTGFTPLPTTFLDGATPDAWRVKSRTTPVVLSTAKPTHVILRRPLREEILADPVFPAPEGARCTYMSLRRATRAFVDHRVTGGRLAHERAKTAPVTRDLMAAAWPADPAAPERVRKALKVASRILLNANPPPSAPPGRARDLENVWIAFFPDDVPAQDIDGTGSLARTKVYTGGEMFYALWQTIEGVLKGNGTKRNFSNEFVGTGAPGAIVAVGLSSGFLTRPPHAAPHPTAADLTANVDDMLTALTPGTMLQFWNLTTDYRVERSRVGDIEEYGHSPLFQRYLPVVNGKPSGIVVVDQYGDGHGCPVANGQITWGGARQAVWIAAQWDD